MLVVGVHSQKGGPGKSTIALLLASAAAREGVATLLIDADPQGTVTAWSAARQRIGLGPVPGLTVVQRLEPDLHRWARATAEERGAAFVVIDGVPRADEARVRSIISASSVLLVPVQPSFADLDAARPTLATVRDAQARGVRVKAAIVASRVKPGTNLARDFGDLAGRQGVPVLSAGTSDRVAYPAALSAAQTVFEYEGRGTAAQEGTVLLEAVRRFADG